MSKSKSMFNRFFLMEITLKKYLLIISLIFTLFSFFNPLIISESNVESITNVFISTNTTWTSSNSPYIFGETVVVETGAILTIESGVTVKFTSGYGMLVEGTLIAIGTIVEPIIFTSNSSSPSIGDWDEVKLRSSLGNIFYFCIFEFAGTGISMTVQAGCKVSNCTFRYNNYGFEASNSIGEVQYSSLLNNNNGIRTGSSAQVNFTYNEIAHNNQLGIYTYVSDESAFTNNSIHDNGDYGISTHSCYSQFHYNNITDNMGGGISIWETITSRTIDFHFNNLINNTGYNVFREVGTPAINVSLNYWGTANETEIQELIYDYYDDPLMLGKMEYQPYLNNSVEIFISFSDSRMPSIAIFNPSNNTSIDHNSIWLNFTIDEFTAWIGYSINGNPNTTIIGDVLLPSLSEGLHSVIVYANDTSGNMGVSPLVWFTIDLTPPIVNIMTPSQVHYIDSDVLVQYSFIETGTIQFYLNDALYPFIANESAITLSDGQYNLTLTVTDPAGNVGIATVIFTVDTLPPDGIIISPGDQYYNYEDIIVTWWQEPSSSVLEFFVDNTSTSITNNSIEYFIEGVHNITMVIQDQAGNLRIITHIFEIDLTAPEVTILSPNPTTYQTTDIMLNFITNEDEEVSIAIWVYLDGELNPISNNSIIPGLKEGEHNITIEIIDAAGNKALKTVIFIIELPTTTITTTTTTSTTITLTTTSPASTTTTTEETTPEVSEGFGLVIPSTILLIMAFYKKKR